MASRRDAFGSGVVYVFVKGEDGHWQLKKRNVYEKDK